MENKSIVFEVPVEFDGASLKGFLKNYCSISARVLVKLKSYDSGIMLNSAPARVTAIVRCGDIVTINMPDEEVKFSPSNGEISVIYENNRIILLDKPAGIPVHPVKAYQEDTLANRLCAYMISKNESYTFRAINRLDKDTSGIVVVAKDKYTASLVKDKIHKKYLAICEGELTSGGTIDLPIALKENSKIIRTVREDGLPAVTHYEPIKVKDGHTLVSVELETGRTHQIRCHFASMGYPLAGDDLYGGSRNFIGRQALHCYEAAFFNGEETLTVRAELPSDFFILP